MRIRITGLLRKEIIGFFRDRVMLILILWLYTAEVIICTVALSFQIQDLPLLIVDQDQSTASLALSRKLEISASFDLLAVETSPARIESALQSGAASAVIVIPHGFEKELLAGSTPRIQALQDGSNSNTAANALHYSGAIIERFAREWKGKAGQAGGMPVTRIWYNPELQSATFMVLSMIALAGMMVGVIHPAASIVREKEEGTIEQLMVTPIQTAELFFAKVVPTFMIGLLSLFPSLLIARLFGVPLAGSLSLFLFLTFLFLLSAISLGVLIAAWSNTLQQALLLSFFGLFPIMFLSGSLTPVDAMPAFLQWVSLASPLRHYMDIITGIFLKGTGWQELWDEALALVAIGLPLFVLAHAVFRRRLA